MTSEPPIGAQVRLHYRELAEQLPNSAVYIFDGDLRVVFAGGSLMAVYGILALGFYFLPHTVR